MKTNVWNIDPMRVSAHMDEINQAAYLLQQQEVVAFPTETVYGLGADATSEQAVHRIFEAKGRPSDNPLIVHVADASQVGKLVTEIPETAKKMMASFMPGPLTIVLESNGACAENVTAGLSTVAVRIPNHPVALALLKTSDLPLAAPSANRSGRPSPTTADHVYQDLNGRVAGLIDGGPTGVGLESTVVDCTSTMPVILRPGGITRQQIEDVIGAAMVDPALASPEEKPKSPGMKYTHYAPEAPLWLVDGSDEFFIEQLQELERDGKRIGIIASNELAEQLPQRHVIACGSRNDLKEVAVHLYSALREFKKADVDIILGEAFSDEGYGEAIMNRLQKAAVKKLNQF
ncbi:L-threonylcarbamoyladenylate synthase [Thalassobacillus devorans]|uniref:L-threonylcarbamoyladenylate synthase n=1 Tax=Thalassobacillus devorans TaxID=279813 RepID=UPI00048ADF12|nr:L-threonylcarbamoyladenylate synthase [Thalassobacillus devorans]